jgi:hypothetical protein
MRLRMKMANDNLFLNKMFLPMFIYQLQAAPVKYRSKRQRKTDYKKFDTNINTPFANSYIGIDGKRVCEEGYISGPVIDKRGCWKCIEICDTVSECVYPGTCVTKVPEIENLEVKVIDKTNMMIVSYTIPDFVLENNPEVAYCKFNEITVKAASVTKDKVYCKPIDEYESVSISFDQQSWSDIVDTTKTEPESDKKSNTTVIVIVGIVAALCIAAGVFVLLYKRYKKTGKKENPSISKPLAYFPTVDDAEKKPAYY